MARKSQSPTGMELHPLRSDCDGRSVNTAAFGANQANEFSSEAGLMDSALHEIEPGAPRPMGDVSVRRHAVLAQVSLWCGVVAAAIGALTIIGWLTGAEYLASLRTRYIPMAPSTALCFALLGFAINVRDRSAAFRIAAIVCTGIVAAVQSQRQRRG